VAEALPRERPPLAVVRTADELRAVVAGWRTAGETVGLVATMGAIHAGHLGLVAAARSQCNRTIASLFVNPTQFGAGEDLDGYPDDEERDAAALAESGVDLLFAPSVAEMYPDGFATAVTVSGLTDGLCGAERPGHFQGVATVVARLLGQCTPDAAYFGEKDYQQLLVIRRMVQDLAIKVEICAVATVREKDGLACSSRNTYLTAEERTVAPVLYHTIKNLAERLAAGAERTEAIAQAITRLKVAGFSAVDYLELCHAETLEPVETAEAPCRLLAAAWLGEARLIDNVAVGLEG
jgi:pantoate--beta-alanine ligase